MVEVKKQTPVSVTLTIPKTDLPAPQAANWFHLTRANADIQLLVGYVDPLRAAEYSNAARSGQKNLPTLSPDVGGRVAMSLSGFLYLRQQVNELFDKMRDSGMDSEPSESKPGA